MQDSDLNCTFWMLSVHLGSFLAACGIFIRAAVTSSSALLGHCSSKLSHWAKGTASAAPARSACVLSHLGKRPHTWAGVALSLSWMDWLGILWLLQEHWGCWGWLVCSWPGHTGGSQLLQTSPAVSIYDSDGSTQGCLNSYFVSLVSALLQLSW